MRVTDDGDHSKRNQSIAGSSRAEMDGDRSLQLD